MIAYLFNVAIALDYLASAILNGRPGETLSGRAGSAYLQGRRRGRICAPIINFIMRDNQHCQNAVQGDILRARAVIVDQGGHV